MHVYWTHMGPLKQTSRYESHGPHSARSSHTVACASLCAVCGIQPQLRGPRHRCPAQPILLFVWHLLPGSHSARTLHDHRALFSLACVCAMLQPCTAGRVRSSSPWPISTLRGCKAASTRLSRCSGGPSAARCSWLGPSSAAAQCTLSTARTVPALPPPFCSNAFSLHAFLTVWRLDSVGVSVLQVGLPRDLPQFVEFQLRLLLSGWRRLALPRVPCKQQRVALCGLRPRSVPECQCRDGLFVHL
jgi:hypothetical protein